MSNIALSPQTYVSNGVELTFIPDTIKKGVSVGNPILRPETKSLSLTVGGSLSDFLGGEACVRKILERIIQQDAAAASRESYKEETGNFDLEQWKNEIAGVSIGS